jgi:hypothetical protein
VGADPGPILVGPSYTVLKGSPAPSLRADLTPTGPLGHGLRRGWCDLDLRPEDMSGEPKASRRRPNGVLLPSGPALLQKPGGRK